MPFKSKAQARFLFAKHLDIAEEFASKTSDIKSLPEHVKELDELFGKRKKKK